MAQGELALADEAVAEALDTVRQPPPSRWMTWRYAIHCHASLGQLALLRGDPGRARRLADEALATAMPTRSRKYESWAWRLVGESATATLLSSESYPALHNAYVTGRPAFNNAYEAVNRSAARDLREIAKVIYGVEQGAPNVHAHFFQLTNDGYDTHSDQGAAAPDGQHANLHQELGDSLGVFYDDLADMGVADCGPAPAAAVPAAARAAR